MKRYLFLIVSAVLIGIDQIIKVIAETCLPRQGTVVVIDNFLHWTYIENRGAAFSILEGARWFLIVATLLILVVCVFLIVTKKVSKTPMLISLSLIIAGGAGNLIDRIARGYVIDYIDISFAPLDWFAIFNFADCLVVVGTILMLIYIIFEDVIWQKHTKIPPLKQGE